MAKAYNLLSVQYEAAELELLLLREGDGLLLSYLANIHG